MKKPSNRDGATPKEDVALCRRCGEKHKKNHSSSNQNEEILKRRRCDKPKPKPAHNIPEARVVQEPWDCAFVSDSDGEDDRRDSNIAETERLLQESIERHFSRNPERLFTFSRNPEFFVVVHRNNNFDDDGHDL
eukprot:scaffold2_cov94-Skeletonema_dohrnii-CCMP3373.AAC.7